MVLLNLLLFYPDLNSWQVMTYSVSFVCGGKFRIVHSIVAIESFQVSYMKTVRLPNDHSRISMNFLRLLHDCIQSILSRVYTFSFHFFFCWYVQQGLLKSEWIVTVNWTLQLYSSNATVQMRVLPYYLVYLRNVEFVLFCILWKNRDEETVYFWIRSMSNWSI